MPDNWKKLFSHATPPFRGKHVPQSCSTLHELKHFLDLCHIKFCLAKPYFENKNYPLVEIRELLPSFEADPYEYRELPGFSLIALARPIDYFSEIFQFELLHPPSEAGRADLAQVLQQENMETFLSRLPRNINERFKSECSSLDVCDLSNYPALSPYLLCMDRAQVIGIHGSHPQEMRFYLAGVYASFPSDLDTEVKHYGVRIGKFSVDDPDSYEENRLYVLQHLMELYGYPIASERRTSAALFARRLHKMEETFLIRTLGQSDRTLSTIWNDGVRRPYPVVEKIALVRVEDTDKDLTSILEEEGYFLDQQHRVVILRVTYKQHKFSRDNVRQDRAISIDSQEVIHPLTGAALTGVNIVRDTTSMLLRLNDIVRGEHAERITYKRYEVIDNTESHENRLKVLYAALSKHQRRLIGYSDEFFTNISKVLDNYLCSPENQNEFNRTPALYKEVMDRYSYIQQARKIRILEDLLNKNIKGIKITYLQMLGESVRLLHDLKFEIVSYFDTLVATAITIGEHMLNDRYLIRTYISKPEDQLTENGREIRKQYNKLIALIDELKAIRKSRVEIAHKSRPSRNTRFI